MVLENISVYIRVFPSMRLSYFFQFYSIRVVHCVWEVCNVDLWQYSRRAGGRNKTSSRQRAHVDEQFYDWLDDDLGSANQTRRRRCVSPWLPTATNQRAGSSGTQSTARRASGGGGGGSKELSISRQSPVTSSSASRSVSSSDSDGDECERTSVTCVSITDSSHSPPRKRHRQSRLTPLVQVTL